MTETDKETELKAWQLLLEDDAYRLDKPEDFYQTLVKRADELVLREVINLQEWQKLKDTADSVYELTTRALAQNQRGCVNRIVIDLEENK
jgi:hypothetical protein